MVAKLDIPSLLLDASARRAVQRQQDKTHAHRLRVRRSHRVPEAENRSWNATLLVHIPSVAGQDRDTPLSVTAPLTNSYELNSVCDLTSDVFGCIRQLMILD